MNRHQRRTLMEVGLFAALAAVFFCCSEVYPAFAESDAMKGLTTTATTGGISTAEVDMYKMIGKLVNALLGAVGVIFLILSIYAGALWMTARGAAEQVKKAQTMLVQAVIGVIIIFASYAITNFILENTLIASGLGQKVDSSTQATQ